MGLEQRFRLVYHTYNLIKSHVLVSGIPGFENRMSYLNEQNDTNKITVDVFFVQVIHYYFGSILNLPYLFIIIYFIRN